MASIVSRIEQPNDALLARYVARLLLNTVMPNGGEFTDAVAAEYVLALRDFSLDSARQACDDFRLGIRGDGRFAPMPGELAKAAREIEAARISELARTRAEQEERAMLRAAKARPKRTPEEIARVDAAVAEFKAALAKHGGGR
jgi:hypothetical protein